jgi:hypothetical protein
MLLQQDSGIGTALVFELLFANFREASKRLKTLYLQWKKITQNTVSNLDSS